MLDHAMVVYDAFYTWCSGPPARDAQLDARTGRGMTPRRTLLQAFQHEEEPNDDRGPAADVQAAIC